MTRKRLSVLLTTGAISAVLAAAMILAGPSHASAQDDDSVASPDSKTPPAQMKGTWTGPINDVKNGAGTLTLDLTQVKTTVGGTFSADWSNQNNPSGSVHGKANGNKVTLTVAATNQSHACKVQFTGEVLTLDEYKGTYKSLVHSAHCKAQGDFDVTLQ